MSNSEVEARLIAEGYEPLWHEGTLIYTKRDRRTPLQRELGVFESGELRPSLSAYRVALREAGAPFGLEALFAFALAGEVRGRPLRGGVDRTIEHAARTALDLCKPSLCLLAEREGFHLSEYEGLEDAIVREMAETLPKSEPVKRAFANKLKEMRQEVFAELGLTHADPNVFIHVYESDESPHREILEQAKSEGRPISEPVRTTLIRTIAYIEFMDERPTRSSLFLLHSVLTRMLTVGEWMLGEDF